jgi:hypothetical protein
VRTKLAVVSVIEAATSCLQTADSRIPCKIRPDAVLYGRREYKLSTTRDPKPVSFQAFPPMEPTGIEPVTSCLQSRRSPS